MDNKTIEEKLVDFPRVVALTMDDGYPSLFRILTAFPSGDKTYVALAPSDADGNVLNSDISLFEIADGEGESLQIRNIEDNEEYSRVADTFYEICAQA